MGTAGEGLQKSLRMKIFCVQVEIEEGERSLLSGGRLSCCTAAKGNPEALFRGGLGTEDWSHRRILTLGAHAHSQAFLKAAVLAAVAVVLGDGAVLVATTGIAQLLADAALEEAFASLAADHPIVTTWSKRKHLA